MSATSRVQRRRRPNDPASSIRRGDARRREYERISPSRQTFAVYGRVVVLHVAIVIGGLVIAILGSPIWILVVLIAGKTLFDLSLDRRRGDVRNELTGQASTRPRSTNAP
jgi:hypothetical protein